MIRPEDIAGLTRLKPWELVTDQRAADLDRELDRELSPGHALAGTTHTAITARTDQDDVLYLVAGARLAIVHLTWSEESDSDWPSTTFVPDVEAFADRHMRRDHESFTR